MTQRFMTSIFSSILAALGLLIFVAESPAAPLLNPNDFIIAIDTDPMFLPSEYPGEEGPLNALDGDSGTKYLNFGILNTGFIIKPFMGPSTARSIQLTTANDHPERDPFNWQLFGTNDPITSVEHGDGSSENWTFIAGSEANLPEERFTPGPVQSFSNTTSYSAYKVLFPTVKNPLTANSMQIADVMLYESTDGSGLSIWDAFETDVVTFAYPKGESRSPGAEQVGNLIDGGASLSGSNYPTNEGPANVVDGTLNKYFNGAGPFSGFIVTPASGPSQLQSFQITTANDAVDRDPKSYRLWGTNDPITSADNSTGDNENWTLLGEGDLALPAERDTLGPIINVANNSAYSSYKLQFPTTGGNRMQIAEATFFDGLDGSGSSLLAPGDPVLAFHSELTKYLNFGGKNSGFIVTPGSGASVMTSFQITTGDDATERDPTSYELYGTNDPITSEHNSQGTAENWVLISSGELDLPLGRNMTSDPIAVSNSTSYSSYRMVFPSLREDEVNGAMQIAGIQFFDDSVAGDGDFNNDGQVDGRDFLVWQRNPSIGSLADWQNNYGSGGGLSAAVAIPEPATLAMVLGVALAGLVARGRSRV